ncbi:EAL domain-containing protein [Lederbergia panacisoli]|uniref:EAL domain-containing protein n=1 Tax=Lederbergia panacisoli TaxID=1255251 RepID=UPI00214B6A6C|nr:EAL domain-containing protein [Lederbergia panacisoli]MCR2821279.1 EAL domain-containing protein [Lederbergia panacisoli]
MEALSRFIPRRKVVKVLQANTNSTFLNAKQINLLFEHHPDAVVVLDVNRNIIFNNKSVREMFGYDKQDLSNHLEKIFYKHDKKRSEKYFELALKGKEQEYQATILHKSGELINVDITLTPILNDEMEVVNIYAIVKDITQYIQSKEEESNIKRSLELAQKVGKIGTWKYTISKDKAICSKQMYEIFGVINNPESITTQEGLLSFVHPDDRQTYLAVYENALEKRTGYSFEHRIIRRDGEVKYLQEKADIHLDDKLDPTHFTGTIQDITKMKETEKKLSESRQRLEHLAYHDYLTDIPNRLLFERKIMSLIESGKGDFSIMYLDLDRLRTINESLGHMIGDQLLKEFSQRINSILGKGSLLARIGGDEFGIVVWDYDEKSMPVLIAKKIIDSLVEPFFINDYELVMTTCVGISSFPSDGKTFEELVKNASAALHRAKDTGNNNYHIYSSSLNITSYKLHYLEKDLRKSIDNKQLLIHLQPRVDAATGRIISAEALVRWEHPVWGLVSPNEFIPLAEETGFINEIGDWVLTQVCQSIGEWKAKNLNIVPISINISAQRFLKSDWKSTITYVLEKYKTDPTLIELEITETTLIKHDRVVESAFQFLKTLGIKIALDDFGTGYSSLAYVKNFSIDTIKIDKSFIEQINKTENVEIIIKSLIFMAKGLGLSVVAEGVETIEQLTFLKQQECHEIQGYIYSKPVPKEKFQSLLMGRILKPIYRSQKPIRIERREFYRIDLLFPLCSSMSLMSVEGNKVNLGKTDVLIVDIGPGGLKFLSTIHLPVRPDILFQFETTIMGENVTLNGQIVWKDEINDAFQYGLQFILEEVDRDTLIKLLNSFSLQLRNNPIVPNCKFVQEEKFSYLKKINTK